jgi:hypothetical protein
MQDEIVSRLANTLDERLTEQEARRSARSPHPSSMDLYFQGKALLNKGWTPEHVKQAGTIFQRALALDPQNIEAMVGKAIAETRFATSFMSDDQRALRAATEVTLAKLLSVASTHASAHLLLGVVLIFTNRAAQGMAECERALVLDRNLAERTPQLALPSMQWVVGRKRRCISTKHSAFLLVTQPPIIG